MKSNPSGSTTRVAASATFAAVVALVATGSVLGVDCTGSSGGPFEVDGAIALGDSAVPGEDAPTADSALRSPDASADATLSSDSAPGNDGATDATTDTSPAFEASSPDSGLDAGVDSTAVDAGSLDSGTDAAPHDSGEDTGSDAGDAAVCNGVCVVLAAGQDTPFDIATDGVNVYWTDDNGTGTVLSLPVDGGVPVTIASAQSYPYGIALDSTAVYWSTYHADVAGGTVMKALFDGGGASPIAMNQTGPTYLTIQNGVVYWPDQNVVESATTGGVAGPILSSPAASYIASGPSGVYWAGDGTDITTAPLGGTTFSNIVTGQFPQGIAVDSTAVYFANSANNITTGVASIMKVLLDGGSPTMLASGSALGQPVGVAIDATNIYWTDLLNGTVMKVGLNGGAPPVLLASGQQSPWNIAVDAKSVYWTNEGNCPMPGCAGAVMKLTPK